MKIAGSLKHFVLMFFGSTLLCAIFAFAGPGRTTYQAKIVKPDGYPLEASSVNFKFTILDPSATCILYSETYNNVNMSSTSGLISFSLGSGVKTFPVSSTTFEQVFSNITPFLACDSGGPANYSPAASDMRRIVMQFNDGNGWQTLPAMSINAVPYAMYANDAMKFNGMQVSDFVQISTIPSCGASEALRYNGSSFNCVAVGGSGAVTSGAVVTAFGYTPADGASVTALTSSLASTNSMVSSVSTTVFSVSSTVSSLANTVSALVSSQWLTSGTTLSYETGNVGVGTANPGYRLHVMKPVSGATTVGIESFDSTPGIYFLRANGTAAAPLPVSNTQSLLEIAAVGYGQTHYLNSSAAKILISADENWSDTTGAASIRFHTRGTSTTAPSLERLRIAHNGFVGIGTVSPATTLDVNGGLRIGVESNSCTASLAGTLRYSGGLVEYCNGTAWTAFGVAGAGILAINGLTSGSQTFAFGSSGTTPNVSSVGAVHTFNFPYASAATTTAGLISYNDYLNFSNKLNATSGSVISALTFTPANQTTVGASFSAVTTSIANLSASVGAIVSSQWTTSGTAIHYTSGNVGIGTANPDQRLTVSGTVHVINSGNVLIDSGGYIGQASNRAIQFGTETQFIGVNGAFAKFNTGASANSFVLDSNNNVVMGTTAATTAYTLAKTFHIHQYSGSDAGLTNASVIHITNAVTGSNSTDGLYIGRAFDSSNGNQVANIFETRENEPIALRTNNQTRMVITGGGNIGIGTASPTAQLHLTGGTSVTASLKITAGTLLTSAQDGAIEYDGTNLYYTDSTNTRRALASTGAGQTFSGTNTFSGIVNISNNTASTNSSTGALVVSGGVGIGGVLNVSGSTISSYIAGSTVSSGALTLDSTTHSSKGNILLAPSGGKVGIGTTNPTAPLHIVSNNPNGITIERSSNQNSNIQYKNSLYQIFAGMSPAGHFAVAPGEDLGASPALVVTASQTVGVGGVTAPVETLDILGAVRAGTAQSTNGANILYARYSSTSETTGVLGARYSSGGLFLGYGIQAGSSLSVPYLSSYDNSNLPRAVLHIGGDIEFLTAAAQSTTFGQPVSMTPAMIVTNAGDVGIGTSSPARRLTIQAVHNTAAVSAYTGALLIHDEQNNVAPHLNMGVSYNGGVQHSWLQSNGSLGVYPLALQPAGGNVGIGTAGPSFKLQINGSSVANGNAQSSINAFTANGINIQGSIANASQDAITYQAGGSGGGAAIAFRRGGSYDTYIDFYTNTATASAAITRQMVLSNNGYLGIGTSNPTNVLDVNQSSGYLRSLTGDGGLEIGSGNDDSSYIDFHGSANLGADFSGRIEYKDNTGMYFNVNNSTTPAMAIVSSTGHVGIGTTNPGSSKLTVYSALAGGYTVISNTNAAAGGQNWRWYSSSTGAPLGSDAMCFGTGVCYFSLYTTGNATLAGTLTQSSDARLKRDVASIPYALDAVSKLDGVTYYWKDSTKDPSKQLGLIAQDVEKVFPEAVKTAASGFKSVAYQNLIAPLINAVKEIREWMFKTDERIQVLEEARKQDKAAIDDLKKQNELLKLYVCEKDPSASVCK